MSGPLRTFQRTFSGTSGPVNATRAPDADSDELGPDEWPATQRPLTSRPANAVSAPRSPGLSSKAAAPAPGPPKQTPWTAPKAHFATDGNAARSNAVWAQKAADRKAGAVASSSKPSGSGAGSSRSTTTTTATSQPILHKRVFPWDSFEDAAEPSTKRQALDRTESGSRSFHRLGSEARSRSGSPAPLAGPSTLNIRQKVVLSPEQQKVLQLVVGGGNSVFFTGSAGTGKSVLLREIISALRQKYRTRQDAVAVTASTGMAACNIGGITIHSFAGFGLGHGTVDSLVSFIKTKNRKALSRWTRTLVLIIDEVSMVDSELLDKLNEMAKKLRKSSKPFGGMQIIVTGDFFQLPPVMKGSGSQAKFAFDAAAWKEAIVHTVNLTQVFRQKDTAFVDMLNEMRMGSLSAKSIARFHKLSRAPEYGEDLDPTELFPTRVEVDRANMARLNAIKERLQTFEAIDQFHDSSVPKEQQDKVFETLMAPKRLLLKVGAQVMCLKNDNDKGLVNGTTGKVVKFAPAGHMDNGEDDDATEAETVLRTTKLCGMAAGAGADAADVKPVVKSRPGASDEIVPWVVWFLPGDRKSAPEPLLRDDFKVEAADNKVKAQRKQFPVILSWAVSIHKSQGQTLERVKVDLGKVFEAGQAYVALSRATSLDALQVLRFDEKKVRVHPRVIEWSRTLQTLS